MWNGLLPLVVGGYFLTGLVLLTAYLVSEPNGRDTRLILFLFFLPSVGWGLWRYQRQQAKSDVIMVPWASMVLNRMGWLHAIWLSIALFLSLVALFTGWSIHDPFGPDSIANQSGNASGVMFDLGLSAISGMAMLLVMFMALFTFAFHLALFSGIPWLIAGIIRRSHQRALLQELTNKKP